MAHGHGSHEPCALCGAATSGLSVKKKRKRLHGTGCFEEADVLSVFLKKKRTDLSLESFVELKNNDAFLCPSCQKILLKLKKLQEQIDHIEDEISVKINNLHPAVHCHEISPAITSNSEEQERMLNNEPSQSNFTRARTGQKRQNSEPEAVHATLEPVHHSSSPDVAVSAKYENTVKRYKLTPQRKKVVMSIVHGSYRSAAKKVVGLQQLQLNTVTAVAQQARAEMKRICSLGCKSILRSSNGTLKHFSWVAIWEEVQRNVPTLVKLIKCLLPKSDFRFVTMLIAMILKKCCKHMSLVQQAISVVLFGNATNKQVYKCLQPFMLCMSSSATANLIDQVAEGFDAEVLLWSDVLKRNVKASEPVMPVSIPDDDSDSGSSVSSYYSELSISEFSDDEDISTNQVNEVTDNEVNDDLQFQQQCQSELVYSEDVPVSSEVSPNVSSAAVDMHDESLDSEAYDANRCGFVLVMDNVDKNVRPNFQRENKGTRSYHFTHSYAVQTRINISGLSDDAPGTELSSEVILPNKEDLEVLKEEFKIFISRILVKEMEDFHNESNAAVWHIDSVYTADMSSKSRVVPLGIQLKNEAKVVEMCSILDAHNKFVPIDEQAEIVTSCGKQGIVDKSKFVQVLLFGDQLTVERVRGAMSLRRSHRKPLDSLKGFIPAVSDWHARVCLLEVLKDRFYSTNSASDLGSIFRLKHAINRTALKAYFTHNVKATEDFLLVVLHAYVVAAAKTCMVNETVPTSVLQTSENIVSKLVKIYLSETEQSGEDITDMVFNHSIDFLTLSLLWYGYHDSVKEGDGDRILRYWKFLLPLFQQEGHHNYTKEAFSLIVQSLVLSPRKACELKWSRTVNTQGRKGCNIPCDLHMEHLNCRLKLMMSNLGSNISPKAVERMAKSFGVVHEICTHFKEDSDITSDNGYHTYPSFKRDFDILLKELVTAEVFTVKDERDPIVYNKKPLFQNIRWKNINEWIKKKLNDLDLMYCYT